MLLLQLYHTTPIFIIKVQDNGVERLELRRQFKTEENANVYASRMKKKFPTTTINSEIKIRYEDDKGNCYWKKEDKADEVVIQENGQIFTLVKEN